jgi:adenosylhomocysteine nucleosidase
VIRTFDAADGPVRVLFAMAAQAEFGPALRELIQPVMIGVGPVEAAVNTTRALAEHPADLVVSLGSAGSRSLPQAEIFQVGAISYRDMDASPLGFETGRTPFLDLPAVVPIHPRLPGVPVASLSTGGAIISGGAYADVPADMVDMESFAVMRAAMAAGAGMIGLRGISDGAEPVSRFSDWTRYLAEIDVRLAAAVAMLPDSFANETRRYWCRLPG